MAGLAVRGSLWLLLAGGVAFAWAAPLLTPWQENPVILQPARAQAAWMYAWIALFTWLPYQASALGRRLQGGGLLEFFHARGHRPAVLCLQLSVSILLCMLAVVLVSCAVSLTVCLPKNPGEAWLWLGLVLQYAVLYFVTGVPLVVLGVALGTCAGEVIAFLVPACLLYVGLLGASWLEPVLAGSDSFLHRLLWLVMPHYHLADLTQRLVFKMGPLAQADFLGTMTGVGLQGVALTLAAFSLFRTRS